MAIMRSIIQQRAADFGNFAVPQDDVCDTQPDFGL